MELIKLDIKSEKCSAHAGTAQTLQKFFQQKARQHSVTLYDYLINNDP